MKSSLLHTGSRPCPPWRPAFPGLASRPRGSLHRVPTARGDVEGAGGGVPEQQHPAGHAPDAAEQHAHVHQPPGSNHGGEPTGTQSHPTEAAFELLQ